MIKEVIYEEDWIEFWNAYEDGTDRVECLAKKRVLASILKEKLDDYIKEIDSNIKDKTDAVTFWNFNDYGKVLEMSFKKTSSIDPSIINELSDEECRKGYTVTAKAIESSGRKDLLEKYKSITESKTITLKNIVGSRLKG